MKQKVFKGIINGKEFDNVAEYNAYMTELIEKGEPIQASSTTRIEGEDCLCEAPADTICESCEKERDVNMFPGFERPESYLDVLVTDDPYKDKQTAGQLINYLEEHLNTLDEETDAWSVDNLETYLDDIAECRDIFKTDRADCDKATKVMCSRRDELQHLLNNLDKDQCKINRGRIIIHAYEQFYQKLQEMVKNKLIEKCSQSAPTTEIKEEREPATSFGSILQRFLNLK